MSKLPRSQAFAISPLLGTHRQIKIVNSPANQANDLGLPSWNWQHSALLSSKFGHNLEAFSPQGRFSFVFERYLDDIEQQTNLVIGEEQRALIFNALSTQTFSMVDFQTNRKFHKRFQRKKARLIKEWEKETGQKWPRYYKDIYNDKGEVLRFKGQTYDAHHIIECIFSGPAEWWNIHPAATPDEHQEGIHRYQGLAWWIFYDHCENEEECQVFANPSPNRIAS
ncbi:MAG: hypothetical protein HRU09_10215 [Oligoflexales bacterium]|nr:hypothetical protein [Oligoflexales bacterium]